MANLNKEQLEAVQIIDGPVLVLAAAGTGKTTMLVHRIAYLIEHGVDPGNILAVTFTNKAAGEMKERVNNLVPGSEKFVFISTFHSMCLRILRRFHYLIDYKENFAVYDTANQISVIKSILKDGNIQDIEPKDAHSYIEGCKMQLVDPAFAVFSATTPTEIAYSRIYQQYQKILENANAMDFDDLIMKTVLLFQNHEEALAECQERFQYIMVDEYQDTDNLQYMIVSMLADKHKNVFVVGDDDQSIYSFRGADVRNILSFEEEFKNTKTIRLERNYRSTYNILNCANSVIKNNKMRKEKSLKTDKVGGSIVDIYQLNTDIDEANFIANKIRNRQAPYNECAILYRRNSQSRAIEKELVKLNIPYRIYGSVGFYQRKEIKDIIAYLMVIENHSDDISLLRIINTPRRGIGPKTIGLLRDYAVNMNTSIYDAIMNYEVTGIRGKAVLESLDSLREFFKDIEMNKEIMSVVEIVRSCIFDTKYMDDIKSLTDQKERQSRTYNIEEMINNAAIFMNDDENEDKSLNAFLNSVSLMSSVDDNTNDGDAVTLMTMHAAKGLEYKEVFICGAEEGILPTDKKDDKPKAVYDDDYEYMFGDNQDEPITEDELKIEEERRLFYVAITRAKERLTITYAVSRYTYGSMKISSASRFILELPPESTQFEIISKNGYVPYRNKYNW